MIRDITIGQYYPANRRNTPSGSQGEDRGDTVISDLVVCTEKRTRLSGCNLVPGRGDPFK